MHRTISIPAILLLATLAFALSPVMPRAEPVRADTVRELLQPKLDSMRAQFVSRAPKETINLYEDAIGDLRQTGILERALKTGDTAPDFVLTDAAGKTVQLAQLLSRGPVVIVWYRGGWCPYCHVVLRAWMDHLPQLEGLGARLVAVSPEVPDSSLSTKERLALKFEVLSDPGNRVAREYGLVYKLSDSLVASYNRFFTLSAYSGNQDNELPLAATYVIGTDRVIRYAFVDADYKVRAEPSDVIKRLLSIRDEKTLQNR